jgi:arabinogalactan endo-1,4-beta-galactosidase
MAALSLPACGSPEPPTPPLPIAINSPSPQIRGADLSFTLLEEKAGNKVSENGKKAPIERILANHGANYVRLRLWVDPAKGYSGSKADTLKLARRAADAGMKIYLDLHYSDTWADPTYQTIPESWNHTRLTVLSGEVRDYTRDVLEEFASQGTPVDMVQLGNEVSAGILWPLGKLDDSLPGGGWPGFLTLLRAGAAGVHDAELAGPAAGHPVRIAIHTDRISDPDALRGWVEHLRTGKVPFDLVSLSYYAFWQGPMSKLGAAMDELARSLGIDVLVTETAYPWTLEGGNPLLGIADLAKLPEADRFPPTPAGQIAYFEALRTLISQVPDGHGLGFIDWEPGWLPGVGPHPGEDSTLANVTMFDHKGRMLPVVATAFGPPGLATAFAPPGRGTPGTPSAAVTPGK